MTVPQLALQGHPPTVKASMTKRKIEDEEGATNCQRKPIFTAPVDVAINKEDDGLAPSGSSSPLLRMPSEIRSKIWRMLLGDRLIHLEYLGHIPTGVGQRTETEIFRHTVCENDCPEDEMVEHSIRSRCAAGKEVIWRQPHFDCDRKLAYKGDSNKWTHKSVHLKALRVCRQIHDEASYVLWTTNTFSFNDAAKTFYHFMSGRTTYQKELIKSLRLQMDWVWEEDKLWNVALDMGLLRSLTGLRSLRLQVNHRVPPGYNERAKYWGSNINQFEQGHLELVHRMVIWPLKHVEVFVGDRSQPRNLDTLWMVEDKKDYAEGILRILLDPDAATKFTPGLVEWEAHKRSLREAEGTSDLQEFLLLSSPKAPRTRD